MVETVTATWPAGLPVDAAQPWEELDSDGRVSASLNADSEFLAGCEHCYDCTTGITDLDETVHIESGEPGSGLVAWAMYRVVMGGEQPGVVTADVNPGVMSDGEVSEYYIGLSNYGDGCWEWHGPFTDNHVRLSTGADVRNGADYLSDLGNHFVCIVAWDGATVDVVGVATNSYDETDTEAPPAPDGLHAYPAYGALDVHWDDVLAGDLAGYRLYWSEADFTTADEAGVNCVNYLIGQGSYLLTNLPATTIRVRVSAVDISGNESELSSMASVLVYEGSGPELRLGVSSASGMINDAVTLTATGAVNYAWDLDGDGTYEVTGDTTGVQTAGTGRTGIIRPVVRGTTDDESCVACSAVSLVIASNSRPVASALADPAIGVAPLLCTLTGTGLDNDGMLVSYSWDFDGDGIFDQTDATDPGPVEHTYTAAGMYNAKFRVEDDLGAWDVDTVSIFVSEPVVANNPPVADLAIGTGEESGDCPHSVHFNASGSSDPDPGDSIVRYWWDLDGDGMYEGVTTSAAYNCTYRSPGAITAGVMVEDSHGATATDTVTLTLNVAGNDLPVADLTSDVSSGNLPLTVNFDATGSSDSDGCIVRYDYDCDGDGNYELYDGGDSPQWEYTSPGVINAAVRVTDDDGAQAMDAVVITVSVPGNDDPVADILASVTSGDAPLTVSFNASGSTDSDGSIVLYEWDFDGDGNYDGYGDNPAIDHAYGAGSYTAKLRVTDDDGAQDTDTVSIEVNSPPSAVLHGSPLTGLDSINVAFSAADSFDADGSIEDYEWDFDGDGVFNETGAEADCRGEVAPPLQTYTVGPPVTARMRVTDNLGATGTAGLTLTVHGWCEPVNCVTNGSVGYFTSLAVVDGNPAISYWDSTYDDLKYVRASNAHGTAWGSPLTVDSYGSTGRYTSLAVVDGYPAISYYNDTDRDLMYVRATNAQGAAWGTPVAVDTTGQTGGYTSLEVVNGNPAISYYDVTNRNLMYVRATDPQGNIWNPAVTVDDASNTGLQTSLAVVDGCPAIAYHDNTFEDLKYVRATNAQGTSWGTPQAVDSTGNVGSYPFLAVVNGCPAISYHSQTDGDLRYIRATNAQGSSWNTPLVIDSTGDVGEFTSLAVVNGYPAISYYNRTNGDLKYVRAANAQGTSWGTPLTIDSAGDVGDYTSLIDVDGNPAISYRYITDLDLRFIRLY